MRGRALIAAVVVSLLAGCSSWCGRATPVAPTRHVTDRVGVLAPDTVASLNNELAAYQQLTGHHVLVYVTDTSKGEIHSEWCKRVFNSWGVGRKGHDDGVVLFYFTEDRIVWITVGYGFEKAIPDREAARIYHDVVAPQIKAGDVSKGIQLGAAAILRAIDKSEQGNGNRAKTGKSALDDDR